MQSRALTELEMDVVAAVMDLEYPDSVDIASKTKIRADFVMNCLNNLQEMDLIERVPQGGSYYYRVTTFYTGD